MSPDERWLAVGLAALSLVLALGWAWFTAHRPLRPGGAQLAGQAARLLYFAGFPYAGLISGLFIPRTLGLKGLEHFSLAWPGAGVQRATTLMLVEWLLDSSLALSVGLVVLLLWLILLHSLARRGVDLAPTRPLSLTTALYDSLHWAFYRAAAWLLTGDLYLGVVWGAALALVEGVLVTRLRGDSLLEPGGLLWAMLLLITSTVFYYNPNLWLLLPLHFGLVIIVRKLTCCNFKITSAVE